MIGSLRGAVLERVADSLYLDRNTTIAFKHLVFGRHSRDLRAWLGGDSSSPEERAVRNEQAVQLAEALARSRNY